ncbi:M28 family peptidase, partial [bacterium]|nr:M28 family peptidase [bacterium]
AEPEAPGADDNGSGTAAVLECARILSQYYFEKTIHFVAFAGEEQGLYGSNAFVDDIPGMGIDVVGCFNYDMIAYAGTDPWPPDLVIYADNNPLSLAMAYKVEEACLTFVPSLIEPDVDINPSMGSSDHGPFWDAGLPAICGIEEQAWGPDFNPWYHSTSDIVANCNMDYASNCTRAAIAALADYAVPIVDSGPYLSVNDKVFDEISGNGNHAPDPGETISIDVTLINVGSEPATGISATLSTTDPYLTITQNSATYPDLAPQATGTGSQAYILDISSSCPQAQYVTTELTINAAGGYTNSVPINFLVGDPVYDPTGPDAYGYLAYDSGDEPMYPNYQWIEISPDSGGSGSLVNFTIDDQCLQFDLPFSFRYYGSDYTRFTIAANGWIGMGDITEDDYSNSSIPNDDGPAGMIAAYWEDLSPQRANSGRVWQYYDTANHRLIVEYNHIEQYAPVGNFETFQVILLDPAYYTTETGDGQLIFQYKDLSNIAQSEGTVGIEDPTETMGLQYLYDGGYDVHAADIGDETVIFFDPPSGMPSMTMELTYVSGSPVPAGGGNLYFDVYVENTSGQALNFDAWLEVAYEGGIPTTVVLRHFDNYQPGWTINRPNMFFPVPAAYAAGNYTMAGKVGVHPDLAWAEDNFPFAKSGAFDGVFVPFVPDGVPDVFGGEIDKGIGQPEMPTEFALHGAYPNPFNPAAAISYQLSAFSHVNLSVYDVSGRLVAKLVDGYRDAGVHEVIFDATDLASGMYVYRLIVSGSGATPTTGFSATGKMVLLK